MKKHHPSNRTGRWIDLPATDAEEAERSSEITRMCAEIRSTWTAARWEQSGVPPLEVTTVHCECRLLERFD